MRVGLSGVVGGGRGRDFHIYTGPEGKPDGESRFPLSLKTEGVFNTKLSINKKMMSLFDFIDFDFLFLTSNGRNLSFHFCGDNDDDAFPFRFLVFSAYSSNPQHKKDTNNVFFFFFFPLSFP